MEDADVNAEAFDDVDGAIFTRYKFSLSIDETRSGSKIHEVTDEDVVEALHRDLQAQVNLDSADEANDSGKNDENDGTNKSTAQGDCESGIDKNGVDISTSNYDHTDSQTFVRRPFTDSLTEPSPDITPVATNDQPSERVIVENPNGHSEYDGLIKWEDADLSRGDIVVAQSFSRPEIAPGATEDELNKKYDDIEKRSRKKHACFALLFPMLGSSLFIADIVTDIVLANDYRRSGKDDLFGITVACIVLPSLIMSIVDLSFLYLDSDQEKCCSTCKTVTVVRWIIGLIGLGRLWRAVSHMYNIFKDKTAHDMKTSRKYRKLQLAQKRDCYILDFINAFTESLPQLIVQLYMFYYFDLELNLTRVFSLSSSWVCIAWTYAFHYRSHREVKTDKLKPDVSYIGLFLYFVANLAALAARISCLVLLMVCFNIHIGLVVLGVNFVIMFFWIYFSQKPTLEGLLRETKKFTFGRLLYYFLFSHVLCFCFVNLKDSPTRKRIILFYLIFYVGNFVMAGFIFHKIMDVSYMGNEKAWNLLFLAVGMLVHILCLLLYYKLFHPTVGALRQYKGFPCRTKEHSSDSVEMGTIQKV